MASLNKSMNIPAINKIMTDFMKENQMMEMKEEIMSDAIDDAFEVDESESDVLVQQVYAEIGLDTEAQV